MKIDMLDFAVKSESGFDVDATVEKFKSLLVSTIDTETRAYSLIGAAITEIFDENPGLRTNSKWLHNDVIRRLGSFVTMANFTDIDEKISSYVKTCAENKVLYVSRGPGGGVAKYTEAHAKKEAEEAAKAASTPAAK